MDHMAPLFDYDNHRRGPSTPVRRSIRIAKQLHSGDDLDLLSKIEEEDHRSVVITTPKQKGANPKNSNLRWSFTSASASFSIPSDDSLPGTPTKNINFPFSTANTRHEGITSNRALEFPNPSNESNDSVLKPQTKNPSSKQQPYIQINNSSNSSSDSTSSSDSSDDNMIFLRPHKTPLYTRLYSLFSKFISLFKLPYCLSINYRRVFFLSLFIFFFYLILSRFFHQPASKYDYANPLKDINLSDIAQPPFLTEYSNPGAIEHFQGRILDIEKFVSILKDQQAQLSKELVAITETLKSANVLYQNQLSHYEETLALISNRLDYIENTFITHSMLNSRLGNFDLALKTLISNQSNTLVNIIAELKKEFLSAPQIEDKIGLLAPENNLPDYALYSLGARPLLGYSSTSLHVLNGFISRVFGVGVIGKPHFYALLPGVVPGDCWCCNGNRGNYSFALPTPLPPSAFSIDHPSLNVLSNRSSAPRHIELWASSNFDLHFSNNIFSFYLRKFIDPNVAEPWDTFLGSFEYVLDGPSSQIFPISNPEKFVYQSYQLRILSNWGNSKYTCLYKIRLHSNEQIKL